MLQHRLQHAWQANKLRRAHASPCTSARLCSSKATDLQAKLIVGPLDAPSHALPAVSLSEEADTPTTLCFDQHDLLALMDEGKEYSWQAPGVLLFFLSARC